MSIPMLLVALHVAGIYTPCQLPLTIGADRQFPQDRFGGVNIIESTRTTHQNAELELNSLIRSPHADAATSAEVQATW